MWFMVIMQTCLHGCTPCMITEGSTRVRPVPTYLQDTCVHSTVRVKSTIRTCMVPVQAFDLQSSASLLALAAFATCDAWQHPSVGTRHWTRFVPAIINICMSVRHVSPMHVSPMHVSGAHLGTWCMWLLYSSTAERACLRRSMQTCWRMTASCKSSTMLCWRWVLWGLAGGLDAVLSMVRFVRD